MVGMPEATWRNAWPKNCLCLCGSEATIGTFCIVSIFCEDVFIDYCASMAVLAQTYKLG